SRPSTIPAGSSKNGPLSWISSTSGLSAGADLHAAARLRQDVGAPRRTCTTKAPWGGGGTSAHGASTSFPWASTFTSLITGDRYGRCCTLTRGVTLAGWVPLSKGLIGMTGPTPAGLTGLVLPGMGGEGTTREGSSGGGRGLRGMLAMTTTPPTSSSAARP